MVLNKPNLIQQNHTCTNKPKYTISTE